MVIFVRHFMTKFVPALWNFLICLFWHFAKLCIMKRMNKNVRFHTEFTKDEWANINTRAAVAILINSHLAFLSHANDIAYLHEIAHFLSLKCWFDCLFYHISRSCAIFIQLLQNGEFCHKMKTEFVCWKILKLPLLIAFLRCMLTVVFHCWVGSV